MEMHQVRYFLAVSETHSFTRAAERCHVSQPTLTAAIKKLEVELGGPLLLRDRSGAKLTPLGRLVLPRLQRIDDESRSVALIAENHRRLKQVPLRIGVLCTIGPARLSGYLAAFRAVAPGVEVELQVGTRDKVLRQLEEAEVDLVITHAAAPTPDWCVVTPLYEERYLVVLPPGHRLAAHDTVRLAELSDEPYIDRLSCEMREQVGELCTSRKVALYASYRTEREEWVQSLVAAGVGFAFMPEHSLMPGATTARPLVEPSLQRTVSLLRSGDRTAPPVAKLFWRTLLESAGRPRPGA
ncbi:LysR family transcriptional regulator [Corallococcus carmarthensis]|uniref:LysR family transcriptional regulator n=1 Tax=Corallococcus carmarthensis TaxID=2316728 RepID=A0A3A8JL49_9BACT|nr:LysR family transcriptional regulator [Corallococcus carmarthensis]NOK16172.1 LysR family transcriptional regulator [Corallococcus carmarthensis]RKG96095.1 LysR family transcriptional regulator [Corallococcus carmarthensis]